MRDAGAQAQPRLRKAPCSLLPLNSSWVETREASEAGAHQAIKRCQRIGVSSRWVAPHTVEHAAVARACPQQPQSDLRVFELCQSLQQLGNPGRALLDVVIDKSVIPYGSAQELKVPRDPDGSVGVLEKFLCHESTCYERLRASAHMDSMLDSLMAVHHNITSSASVVYKMLNTA